MTSAPVPLAEQISLIQQVILSIDEMHAFYSGNISVTGQEKWAAYRAVLATLQQHERLVAELDATKLVLEDEEAAHQDTLRLWLEAKAKHERAMAALRAIRLRAQGDGLRTFDKAIFDLMWIDDQCRAALGGAENTAADAP